LSHRAEVTGTYLNGVFLRNGFASEDVASLRGVIKPEYDALRKPG